MARRWLLAVMTVTLLAAPVRPQEEGPQIAGDDTIAGEEVTETTVEPEVGGLFGLFRRSEPAPPEETTAESEDVAEEEPTPGPAATAPVEEAPVAPTAASTLAVTPGATEGPAAEPIAEVTPGPTAGIEPPPPVEAAPDLAPEPDTRAGGDPGEPSPREVEPDGASGGDRPTETRSLGEDLDRAAAPSGGESATDVELPPAEILGELEKPDIFFLLPRARNRSDEQLIRARMRREITRPLIKEWLEEELLLE